MLFAFSVICLEQNRNSIIMNVFFLFILQRTERCANKEICVRTQHEKFAYGFAQTSQITTVIVKERFLLIEEKLLSVVVLHLSEKDLMNDKSMLTEPCNRTYNSCKDCEGLNAAAIYDQSHKSAWSEARQIAASYTLLLAQTDADALVGLHRSFHIFTSARDPVLLSLLTLAALHHVNQAAPSSLDKPLQKATLNGLNSIAGRVGLISASARPIKPTLAA
ncbi:hypothetical protein T07_3168 [Trichinella nelsoni]|uniref:Uncharacterized protein n=1 Tax=Trichinella nelsoni TaxID=6336 RepID=A0A0V0SN13_9BILA|nr:hypothetical protein T07_3168 [Trichinella nelsoni]